MKRLFLFFVVGWLALCCLADTINEPFNNASIPADWTQYVGIDAGSNTFSFTDGMLTAWLSRAFASDGKAYFATPLGDDVVAADTGASGMPEIWMSADIKWAGVASTADTAFLGVFNDFDNDYSPAVNFFGAGIGRGYSVSNKLHVYLRAYRGWCTAYSSSKIRTSSVLYATTAGDTYRVSMHFYQSGGSYLGDISLSNLTNPSEPEQSLTGFEILDSAWLFEAGMDMFGLHNSIDTSAAGNAYKYDNLYFSTTGPISCTNSTGDFTDDCAVNFKDLAVVSEEWLECAMIPSRLCD